jgi:hypothetical protein
MEDPMFVWKIIIAGSELFQVFINPSELEETQTKVPFIYSI